MPSTARPPGCRLQDDMSGLPQAHVFPYPVTVNTRLGLEWQPHSRVTSELEHIKKLTTDKDQLDGETLNSIWYLGLAHEVLRKLESTFKGPSRAQKSWLVPEDMRDSMEAVFEKCQSRRVRLAEQR